MFSAEQPSIPKPPACASIIDVPTGVPSKRLNSLAAFEDNPEPTGYPGDLMSFPFKCYF
jgi:hypothetical protein